MIAAASQGRCMRGSKTKGGEESEGEFQVEGISPNSARNTQHKRKYTASSGAVHADAVVTTYEVR